MRNSITAFIFDLDGVIVDTARFHFASWRSLATDLGFEIPDSLDEELKGLGRMESLEVILKYHPSPQNLDRVALAARKNEMYLENISHLSSGDTLPGVIPFLEAAKERGLRLAIGSGSKNARPILARLGIADMFEAICDGTDISRSKPDPEVFQCAAASLGKQPDECVVFEDAASGIQAAKSAGAYVIGVGKPEMLTEADHVIPALGETNPDDILSKLSQHV